MAYPADGTYEGQTTAKGVHTVKFRLKNHDSDSDPERDSPLRAPDGVFLGRYLDGREALPIEGGTVVWPFEAMRNHAVIFGGPATGKTETTMRIAHEVATKTHARIFFLDGLSSPFTHERFTTLMRESGRQVRSFPDEHLDVWRGEADNIVERLVSLIPADEVPPYDRGLAAPLLETACNQPGGPPRSRIELRERLADHSLFDVDKDGQIEEALNRLIVRYGAFFRLTDHEGGWSWEDADAGYIGLRGGLSHDRTEDEAHFLLTDFLDFIRARKEPDRDCVMFIGGMWPSQRLTETLREATLLDTGFVICSFSGSGGTEARDHDLFGAVETVIVHATNIPGDLADLAGTREGVEVTHLLNRDGSLRDTVTRPRQRPAIPADEVRGLPNGTAWVIRDGRGVKVAIERAPGFKA